MSNLVEIDSRTHTIQVSKLNCSAVHTDVSTAQMAVDLLSFCVSPASRCSDARRTNAGDTKVNQRFACGSQFSFHAQRIVTLCTSGCLVRIIPVLQMFTMLPPQLRIRVTPVLVAIELAP